MLTGQRVLPTFSSHRPSSLTQTQPSSKSTRISACASQVAPAVIDSTADLPSKTARFESLDERGVYTSSGLLRCKAPANMVYEILTDLELCSQVFDNVVDLETEEHPDGKVSILQTCRWTFGPFSGTFKASMTVYEEADSESLRLIFVLIESPFMREFEGRWQVRPAVLAGQLSTGELDSLEGQRESHCEVEHRLSVKPMFIIPGPMAGMMQGVFVAQVSQILDNLLQEINRRQPYAMAEQSLLAEPNLGVVSPDMTN